MRLSLLAAITIAAFAVPGTARDRNAVPEAVATGPARSCIPISTIRQSLVRNDRVIDFRTTNRGLYRVTLPQGCPGLGFDRSFTYATSLSQLCQQDIITVLRTAPIMRGASCGLAPFQPIRLIAKK